MKTSLGLALASIALDVCHATSYASIYLSPGSPPPTDSHPRSITPKAARLLLAQRHGVSQFHSIGDSDDATIQLLNDYGGEEQDFVGRDNYAATDKLLYIVEGVEHPEDVLNEQETANLKIQDPPHQLHNAQLVEDLTAQLRHVAPGRPESSFHHLTQLQGLQRKNGERYTSALATVKSILEQSQAIERTILLMPPSRSTPSKRSPYGTYSMPAISSHIKRQQEEPLEFLPFEEDPSLDPPSNVPAEPSSTPIPAPLPKGLLKICHSSLEAAVAETANCSSHGSVYLRSSGKPACYACRCTSTTIKDASTGNAKTVHWGGAACQKKDVSVPFWLLATVTIALVSVVGWGVGLLVSMGSEDLPSVIGAGVVGPTAGK